ncbi:hypothetical protein V1504DRAFT_243682 [Lipomyces starkeyi]
MMRSTHTINIRWLDTMRKQFMANYCRSHQVVLFVMMLFTYLRVCDATNYNNNLTDSQALMNFLRCIEACSSTYNYTLQESGGLLIQPSIIRNLNYSLGSVDLQMVYCTHTAGIRFSTVLSSNVYYEDDLRNSLPLDTSAHDDLMRRHILLRSEIPGNEHMRVGNTINIR